MVSDSGSKKVKNPMSPNKQISPTVMNLEPYEGIFGLPPTDNLYVQNSKSMVLDSLPVAEIIPCVPVLKPGLSLFSVEPAWGKYDNILNKIGFSTSRPIHIAFLADNFPTDAFSNEYGENFLQTATDFASRGVSELIQMTGAGTGPKAIGKIGSAVTNLGLSAGGTLGDILKSGGGMAMKASDAFTSWQRSLKSGGEFGAPGRMFGNLTQVVGNLAAGQRVDFPNVWKSSSFVPSYTMTIRLYNPKPSDRETTKQHIIGPLAVLLALAVPRSEDGYTFNWPFFHKLKCKGIFELNPAVITNISVIKGGDQQQIAWNQRLSIVDVRIDFASLYASMIAEESRTISNRPTLKSYLKILEEEKAVQGRYDYTTDIETAKTAGSYITVDEEEVQDRVSDDDVQTEIDLIADMSIYE